MLYEVPSPLFDEPIRISLRDDGITVAADESFSFDREGRLLTAAGNGRFYKRGLNGRILEKQRNWELGARERIRRDLTVREKNSLYERADRFIRQVISEVASRSDLPVHERLDELTTWGSGRYEGDAGRYQSIYNRVGILPPDQYMALVLQATEGCHYNKCTFCSFYHDIPFRARPEAEFERHVEEVLDFVGRGIRLRRSIFLADANALVLSHARLLPIFEALNRRLAIEPPRVDRRAWRRANPEGFGGIYSFIDAFTGTRKTENEFREMYELGLRRVYIGMESGHVPLLDFIRKPSMPEEVREVVRCAHAAGVEVGIILMLGIGGRRYSTGHLRDTSDVVNSLGLRQGDILYFSEYVGEAGSDYNALAEEAGIEPLTPAEVRAQADALNAAIQAPPGVKRAVYDIREFVY